MAELKELIKPRKKEALKPTAYKLSEPRAQWLKVLLYGHIGTGKTEALSGLLLNGERLAVITTDFGGNGMRTITERMKQLGRQELLDNVYGVDLTEYLHVTEFLKDPKSFLPDLDSFDPTVLVWEGFSNFQLTLLDEYILSFESAESDAALRSEGLFATRQDWAGMKRGTMRALNAFLNLHGPNRTWHKFVTCHEAKPAMEEATKKIQSSALLQGAAQTMIGGAFDLVIQTFIKENAAGKPEYFYRLQPGEKATAKVRGFKVEPVEAANMENLWKRLTGENNAQK
jgi:hypothetical protein